MHSMRTCMVAYLFMDFIVISPFIDCKLTSTSCQCPVFVLFISPKIYESHDCMGLDNLYILPPSVTDHHRVKQNVNSFLYYRNGEDMIASNSIYSEVVQTFL